MPFSLPARVLNRLCAVDRSATPEIAGAIRTKASSLTSIPYSSGNGQNLRKNFQTSLLIVEREKGIVQELYGQKGIAKLHSYKCIPS